MEHETKVIRGQTWRARLYREEDKASLLRLSAFHYGEKEQAKEEYVDWLYGGSPAGRPFVTVAEELKSGEIVGFLWHVPFQANLGGTSGLCHLGCNGLVHRDYRRQGVYVALHDLVFRDVKDSLFIYGFPKPVAVYPLKKVGIFPVSRIPLLVRPLDIALLTETRFPNPVLRLVVDIGWRAAGATVWRPRGSLPGRWGIQLSTETCFDESFDHFWARVAGKYDIIVRRDRAFLTWRFCSISFRSYSILAARAGGELVGYAVLCCHEIEGVRTGLIMDLLVEPSERGEQAGLLLVEEATHWFQEAKMALAGCLMLPHTQEYEILRREGYVDCPERFAPQAFRLTTTSLSPRVTNQFLARADRWFMTMANHDAV